MMLYPLSTPCKGATHVHFYEVLVAPSASIRLTGNLGTVVDDVFITDPDLRPPVRTISGREYDAFTAQVRADAAAAGAADPDAVDFRRSDLAAWIAQWGHTGDGGEWREANADPEA